jgi:hypothetical protein
MIDFLARFFRGMNMAMGVTTLPEDASPQSERKFVFVWLGIVVFMAILFFAIVYLFVSQL